MSSCCCHLVKKNCTMFNIYFHKPKFLILFDNLWQNMIRSMSKLIHLVHFSYCLDQNTCNYKSTKISLEKQKYKLKYQKQKMLFIVAIALFLKQKRIFSKTWMLNPILKTLKLDGWNVKVVTTGNPQGGYLGVSLKSSLKVWNFWYLLLKNVGGFLGVS